MLSLSPARLQRITVFKSAGGNSRRSVLVSARKTATKEPAAASSTDADIGPAGLAACVAGAVCNPVMLYSEFVLQTTGSGLPPGPGGVYGAIEGLSYLVVLGIIAWSISTKVKTGSGLPAGPNGLLDAVEGVSYLSLLGGIVVFGLQIIQKGSLPGIFG